MSKTLQFRLNNQKFEIINDPNVKFGSTNAPGLVARLQKERPTSVLIEFDGSAAKQTFIEEVAADGGYAAAVAGKLATLTPA